jgi:ribosomal protein S25
LEQHRRRRIEEFKNRLAESKIDKKKTGERINTPANCLQEEGLDRTREELPDFKAITLLNDIV